MTLPPAGRRWRIGIDVGGTFTDLVAVPGDGTSWSLADAVTHKVPSTPHDPSEGVETGLAQLLERGIAVEDVAAVAHGTTIGLNAILQGRVARAALVTSAGHRDVLQIARARMPRSFDLHASPGRPIVPREHVLEVAHRFAADGTAVGGLGADGVDDAELARLVARLTELAPEVVAVSLVGGYAAREAEQHLADRLAAALGVPVTSAAAVWPEAGEYERTTLALLDAQITPLMTGYFTALRERLHRLRVDARVYITTSNGGSVSIESAMRRPVQTVLSGPAGGVSAAATAWPGTDMVTVDMGGTSSDIGVLRGGRPVLTTTATVGPHPLMTPVVEVSAIGAGGGSVISADRSGARPVLRVGPASVGAVPGPAAYGAGGTQPALTDAYVHAGVIDPATFLGGTFPLRADLATSALAGVAEDLGEGSADDAAEPDGVVDAALRVASVGMAARLRTVLAAHGEVPERYTFVAFGGAGGTHAALLADEVGVRRVLVPAAAGTFCALGAAIAPIRRDVARTVRTVVAERNLDALTTSAAELEREVLDWLRTQDVAATGTVTLSADLRYAGQPTTLEVVLAERSTEADPAEPLRLAVEPVLRRFADQHEKVHGFTDATAAVRAETLRASVSVRLGEVRSGHGGATFVKTGARDVRYDGTPRPASVHALADDGEASVTGPAVIEKADTTVLVPAGWTATTDDGGNLHLVRDSAGSENEEG
ncbi:hydantoinase/oxoprolinase family protein [Promicromonospora sukumoe]|uniref:hydantoinase/oxoprolinase family protein n=1 Tax=Promicromonospora sukumoe TaxID=88382 RepID=UPI0003820D7B|nr:hydantoinase/oxoprolinase family protein [Promicromonospora sukumoe]